MKYLLLISAMLLVLVASMAFATETQIAKAGKYSVAITMHPAQPIVGDNHVTLTITDGKEPVKGADISLHIDMVGMSMPADIKASPGGENGQYVAEVNLGMAGQWKLTATVHAMAGMVMDGDGKATFTVTAQPATSGDASAPATPAAPTGLPWPLIIGVVAGIVVVIVITRRHRLQTPGA